MNTRARIGRAVLGATLGLTAEAEAEAEADGDTDERFYENFEWISRGRRVSPSSGSRRRPRRDHPEDTWTTCRICPSHTERPAADLEPLP